MSISPEKDGPVTDSPVAGSKVEGSTAPGFEPVAERRHAR
jgi:hypothetical protein